MHSGFSLSLHDKLVARCGFVGRGASAGVRDAVQGHRRNRLHFGCSREEGIRAVSFRVAASSEPDINGGASGRPPTDVKRLYHRTIPPQRRPCNITGAALSSRHRHPQQQQQQQPPFAPPPKSNLASAALDETVDEETLLRVEIEEVLVAQLVALTRSGVDRLYTRV